MYQQIIHDRFGGDLADLKLPELSSDFYTSTVHNMLPLFGSHEHQANDYLNAVRSLNKKCMLGLDNFECEVFNLMLTKLSQSQRFKNEFHLEPWLGEHTAIHSGHCVIFGTDYLRRARLLSPEKQTDEVVTLRIGLGWGLMLHDMGEILREWSSLGQRASAPSLQEIPEIEHKVFENALHAAIYAVQEGVDGHAADFYRSISDLARRVKHIELSDEGIAEIKAVVEQFEQEVIPRFPLSAENLERKNRFVSIYDTVELKDQRSQDKSDRFLAYAVKVIEHTQGTRYLVRACTKEEGAKRYTIFATPTSKSEWEEDVTERQQREGRRSIPLSLSPSSRVHAEFKYLEQGVGELFAAASTPAEKALARELYNGALETRIEWLSVGPKFIDRKSKEINPKVKELFADVWNNDLSREKRDASLQKVEKLLAIEQRKLGKRHSAELAAMSPNQRTSTYCDVESSERLMSVLLQARRQKYTPNPKDPPLALVDKLPAELTPIPAIDWKRWTAHPFWIR